MNEDKVLCYKSGLESKDCWCNWCLENENRAAYEKALATGWYRCEHGAEDHRKCDLCIEEKNEVKDD